MRLSGVVTDVTPKTSLAFDGIGVTVGLMAAGGLIGSTQHYWAEMELVCGNTAEREYVSEPSIAR